MDFPYLNGRPARSSAESGDDQGLRGRFLDAGLQPLDLGEGLFLEIRDGAQQFVIAYGLCDLAQRDPVNVHFLRHQEQLS